MNTNTPDQKGKNFILFNKEKHKYIDDKNHLVRRVKKKQCFLRVFYHGNRFGV
jgi:hypothetical protein